MTAGVPRFFGPQFRWRIACRYRREPAAGIDHQVAGENFFLPLCHGKEPCVFHYQPGGLLRING